MLKLGYILLCLSCLVLQACNKTPGAAVTKGQGLSSPYSLPKEAYLGMANRQLGDEKSALMILAAGRAIDEGDWRDAKTWLDALPTLPPVLQAQKHILLAKIAVSQNHPQEAIRLLAEAHDVNQLSLYYQVQYHEILAQAYGTTARFPEAIGERILLDTMLPTERERIRNRRVLWLTLTTLPDVELNTMLAERGDVPLLQGWLTLVQLAKLQGLDRSVLLEKLQAWHKQYPNHPAQTMLPGRFITGQDTLYPPVHKVALLLPMTGPLSQPGQALYDGFMARIQTLGNAPQVQVYDTATMGAGRLYEKAISEGAQFVVGPLSKTDVADVAKLPHPVPTLLLNESDSHVDRDTYFLTLSPLNEARQVALKARELGYQHALVIAPSGHWGDEVMRAFEQQWKARGGYVVDVLRYDQNTSLRENLRDFLHYGELKENKRVTHTRREDFDMVFLLAYPNKAREIMPLLRYYDLGRATVFATSSVYTGSVDLKQDRDLDGMVFCDMPYVFTHDMPNKHWSEPLNSYSRLYALGMDSAALVEGLNQLLLFPALGINHESGLLYLNHEHQIVRLLMWGQFKQGHAEPL